MDQAATTQLPQTAPASSSCYKPVASPSRRRREPASKELLDRSKSSGHDDDVDENLSLPESVTSQDGGSDIDLNEIINDDDAPSSEMVFDEEHDTSYKTKSSILDDDSVSSHQVVTLTMTPEILHVDSHVDININDRQLDETEQGLVAVGKELVPEAVAVPEEHMPQHAQNRAAFISITVEKETKDTKLGIALREFDGELQIYSVAEHGILSGAPFRPGDKLRSINNFRCSQWDPSKAMAKMKEMEGVLTIIVQHDHGDPNLVEAMVKKPRRDCKVGIGFMSLRHFLAIGSINPEGYFACSVLNVGDRVISINGNLCCQMNPDDAVTLVKGIDDHVRFIAQRANKTGIVMSRHSFRSTASSIHSRAIDETRLLSAIDHGSKRSYAFFAMLIIVSFAAVYAIQRIKRNLD
jgi:hypothetical protein